MDADIILAGGGLANGLIALALARLQPRLKVIIVEQSARLGGNHVWSFFDTDVAAANRWLVEPLIAHRWPGYDVRFPRYRRALTTPYNSATSGLLDAAVRAVLPSERLVTGSAIAELGPRHVRLADGRRLGAGAVIDGRGPGPAPQLHLAWQKFVGQELRLTAPHGLSQPVVMDAIVPQHDGYRFVYLLPFAADRIFVEDTYYSDGPALDESTLGRRIAEYAAAQGWHVAEVVAQETGVLPVALGGDIDAFWRAGQAGVPRVGLAAALFHPTTGYSLPDAVRTALAVARAPDHGAAALRALIEGHAKAAWRGRGFYRLLDRMLFQAARPAERYRVLERFYRLDQKLIERFYAAGSCFTDKVRVLAGKPPVPIGRAVRAMLKGR